MLIPVKLCWHASPVRAILAPTRTTDPEKIPMQMSFDLHLDLGLEPSIEKITVALKAEGFGILTRIDVHSTFKEKLDADFREYVMLGSCNPKIAWKAFNHDSRVGLLLPCNVTVQAAESGGYDVSIIHPDLLLGAMGFTDDPVFQEIHEEALERLGRVAASLA